MNNVLTEKRAELLEVKRTIYAKQRKIRNFSYEMTEEEYDAMLDECYEEIEICGALFSASYALKNLDPVAYRCGKSDYEGSKDLEEVPEYIALVEELEELEEKETDLENEIEDLENEEEENE